MKESVPVGENEGQLGPDHATTKRTKGQTSDLPTAELRGLSKTVENSTAPVATATNMIAMYVQFTSNSSGAHCCGGRFLVRARPKPPFEVNYYGEGRYRAADNPDGTPPTGVVHAARNHHGTGYKTAKPCHKESDKSGSDNDQRYNQPLKKTDSILTY
jgi:hypothetical protein